METTLDYIRPDLEARLGEHVDQAMQFMPGGRWGQPTGWSRLWRRARGTGRLDDKLSTFHQPVLAVTPTRIAVIETSTMSGAFALTDVFAVWSRDQVTATAYRTEMSLTGTSFWSVSGYETTTTKVVRLVVHTPDGELWADLRTGTREAGRLANALGAKVSPAKV